MPTRRCWIFAFIALTICTVFTRADDQPKTQPFLEPMKENYLKLADETEKVFRHDVLGVWFPACIDDDHGGFYCNFSRDWKRTTPSEGKFSVFQSRMTWVTSQVSLRRADLKDQYLPYAKHGAEFLENTLWDKQFGGFFWGLGDDGKINASFGDAKGLYGISFGLYGTAAAYQATKDPAALKLAHDAFHWTDEHAHDAQNGGYFEWVTREGKVIKAGDPEAMHIPGGGVDGFPTGRKSMNTHIHLLEAFTQLYQVWPDPKVKERLVEMLGIVRDKVCTDDGAMNMFFTADWKPISDRDSYGHDIETAYLLLEAAEVAGQADDPKTQRIAKALVDHVLAVGWDKQHGGVYNEGKFGGAPDNLGKDWWPQFESLNALLMMHELYGKQNDQYFKDFQMQWRFIVDHQIDHEFNGVFETVDADGTAKSFTKSRMWKAAYHDGRALMNVTERLKKLAE